MGLMKMTLAVRNQVTYPAEVYISNDKYWESSVPTSVHLKGVNAAWIPGPNVKPTLWKEEAIDIWAVLSSVKVAAAM